MTCLCETSFRMISFHENLPIQINVQAAQPYLENIFGMSSKADDPFQSGFHYKYKDQNAQSPGPSKCSHGY